MIQEAGLCACGAPLRLVPAPNPRPLDEWAWVDEEGRSTASTGLVEALEAVGGWDGLAREGIGIYSALKAALALGFAATWHAHRPLTTTPFQGVVPWCCGQPMYLGVESWVCRTTKRKDCDDEGSNSSGSRRGAGGDRRV